MKKIDEFDNEDFNDMGCFVFVGTGLLCFIALILYIAI